MGCDEDESVADVVLGALQEAHSVYQAFKEHSDSRERYARYACART